MIVKYNKKGPISVGHPMMLGHKKTFILILITILVYYCWESWFLIPEPEYMIYGIFFGNPLKDFSIKNLFGYSKDSAVKSILFIKNLNFNKKKEVPSIYNQISDFILKQRDKRRVLNYLYFLRRGTISPEAILEVLDENKNIFTHKIYKNKFEGLLWRMFRRRYYGSAYKDLIAQGFDEKDYYDRLWKQLTKNNYRRYNKSEINKMYNLKEICNKNLEKIPKLLSNPMDLIYRENLVRHLNKDHYYDLTNVSKGKEQLYYTDMAKSDYAYVDPLDYIRNPDFSHLLDHTNIFDTREVIKITGYNPTNLLERLSDVTYKEISTSFANKFYERGPSVDGEFSDEINTWIHKLEFGIPEETRNYWLKITGDKSSGFYHDYYNSSFRLYGGADDFVNYLTTHHLSFNYFYEHHQFHLNFGPMVSSEMFFRLSLDLINCGI